MESKIIIGTSKNLRFAIADTTDIAKQAVEYGAYAAYLTTAELNLLNIVAIMSSSIKSEKSKISLILKADGLLGKAKARARKDGKLISSMNIDDKNLEELNSITTVEDFEKIYKIGEGTMLMEQDLGLKLPYASELLVEKSKSIEEVIQDYYLRSEQLDTIIKTGIKFDDNNKVYRSGAIFIQAMPNSSKEVFELIKSKINMMHSIEKLLSHDFSLEKIVSLIFEDVREGQTGNIEEYRILEQRPLTFACDCSKDYFKSLLSSVYTKKQRQDILDEEGFIETVCGFCNATYRFEEAE